MFVYFILGKGFYRWIDDVSFFNFIGVLILIIENVLITEVFRNIILSRL